MANPVEIIITAIDQASAAIAAVGSAAAEMGDAVAKAGERAADGLGEVEQAAADSATRTQSTTQSGYDGLRNVVDSAMGRVRDAAATGWEGVKTATSNAAGALSGIAGGGLEALKNVVGAALSGLASVAAAGFEALKGAAASVFGALPGIASAGIGALGNAIKGSIETALQWDNQMDDLQSKLGLTAEQAAGLAIAVQRGGGSVEAMSGQMMKLTMGLKGAKGELGPSGEALKALGVSAYETGETVKVTGTKLPSDKLSDMSEKLKTAQARLHDMEAAFKKAKNPTESQTLALQRQREAVAKLGTAVTDGGAVISKTLTKEGPMKDSAALLAEIATKIDAMPPGLEKTQAQMKIFGRSGKDLDDVLHQLANGGMDRATKMAQDFGLVVDNNKSDEYTQNMADLSIMFKAVAINVGNQLLPVLVPVLGHLGQMGAVIIPKLIEAIRPVIERFGALATQTMPILYTAFGKLWDAVQPIIGTILDLAAQALPFVAQAITFVAGVLSGDLTTAAGGAGSVFSGFAQVIGQVVSWVITNWPQISATITTVFDQIVAVVASIVVPVFNAVMSIIGGIIQYVVANWPSIQSAIGAVVTQIGVIFETILVPAFNVVRDAFVFVVEWIAANWPRVQSTIEGVISVVVGVLTAYLVPAFAMVKDIVMQIVNWFVENLPLIESTFSIVFGGVITVVTSVVNTIVGFIKQHLPQIQTFFADVFGGIKAVVSGVITIIGGVLKSAMLLINGDTKGALDTMRRSFTDAFTGVFDWIKGILPKMVEIGRQIVEGITKGLEDAGERLKGFLVALVKSALGKLADFLGIASPSRLMHWYGSMMATGMADGIAANTGKAAASAMSLAAAVSSPIAGIGGGTAPITANAVPSAGTNAQSAGADATASMMRTSGPSQPIVINLKVDGQTIASTVYDFLAPAMAGNVRRSYAA